MNLFESVLELSSYRSFRDETVPRKKIGKILEAGRNSPSPGNVQSLEFIVVEDEHKLELLSTSTGEERFEDAPTALLIITDVGRMARTTGEEKAEEYCNAEAAAAAHSMRLVSEEEGLASCWIAGFDSQPVAQQFRVPDGKKPVGAVLLGFSEDRISEPPKFGMNQLVFYDEYDNQVASFFDSIEWRGLEENKEIYGKKFEGLKKQIARRIQKLL